MQKNSIAFLNDIKINKITIEEAKASLVDFNKYLNMIRKGNENLKNKKIFVKYEYFFNGRNHAIKFVKDYVSMILEAKRKATEGK